MTTSLVPFGTRYPSLFEDFRREVDSLMNRFFDRDLVGIGDGDGGTWFSPLANFAETENEYEVTVDLPGLKPEDFTTEIRNGDLWITGERKQEHEEKQKNWHCVERRYGQFRRVIGLGQDVDAEKINAEYRDGVLKITAPKAETAKLKRIPVKG